MQPVNLPDLNMRFGKAMSKPNHMKESAITVRTAEYVIWEAICLRPGRFRKFPAGKICGSSSDTGRKTDGVDERTTESN